VRSGHGNFRTPAAIFGCVVRKCTDFINQFIGRNRERNDLDDYCYFIAFVVAALIVDRIRGRRG